MERKDIEDLVVMKKDRSKDLQKIFSKVKSDLQDL